ncbi:MAG: hypothetical protein OEW00_14000 [candidate division Zixibacteria bacterium]|nr:hypothetical protein [candidate division Zixibacteria bacterium]
MAEEDKKNTSEKRITESQRFKFIGFEVFPGKVKDLFKSESEKSKWVESVVKRREKGDILREQCTLLEDRVTVGDRVVMVLACAAILMALFLPWYSAYNVIEETVPIVAEEVAADSLVADSAALAAVGDSLKVGATVGGAPAPAADTAATAGRTLPTRGSESEEIIYGMKAQKKVHKEFSRLSGLGSFIALGSVGSMVFSSGFVLVITAVVLLVYTLLCILLPLYTLYGMFGLKGDVDQKALQLKRIVRFNWIPVIMFAVIFVLSFFGGQYGFEPSAYFASIGASYGPGVFLDSLSWGIIITMSAFILIAVKGIEI